MNNSSGLFHSGFEMQFKKKTGVREVKPENNVRLLGTRTPGMNIPVVLFFPLHARQCRINKLMELQWTEVFR